MKNRLDANAVFAAVLAVLAVVTVILQIASSNQSTTRVETTLFSVLQFVFSLGFAWVLARISLRSEFTESQRQFAISAYRRINEISSGVRRLLSRARNPQPTATAETRHELEVIQAIATGVSDSIDSSIADWADIIGPELATLEKIQELKEEDSCVESAEHPLPPGEIDGRLQKLESLIDSLPLQLQVVARAERKQDVMKGSRMLDRERAEKGVVRLTGFWDDTFARDVWELALGARLTVRTGDARSRVGCLIAYDDNNQPVGVLTNSLPATYGCFTESVIKHVGKSQFTVELTEIDRKPKGEGGRHYFKVNLIDYSPEYSSAAVWTPKVGKDGRPLVGGRSTEQGTRGDA